MAAAEEPGYLADYIASNTALPVEEKQEILGTISVEKRMEKLLVLLERESSVLEVERDIQEQVHEQIDRNQKEYYLREQMRVISSELGEADQSPGGSGRIPGEDQQAAAQRRKPQEATGRVRQTFQNALWLT